MYLMYWWNNFRLSMRRYTLHLFAYSHIVLIFYRLFFYFIIIVSSTDFQVFSVLNSVIHSGQYVFHTLFVRHVEW
jgi:hypothetical protein